MRRSLFLAAMGAFACVGVAKPAIAFDPASTIGLYGHRPLPAEQAKSLPGLSLTRAYIPDQIDLSDRMPPPVKQSGGSCVAFSAGYAARGYYALLEADAYGEDASVPSPARLHTRIRAKDVACADGGSHHALAYDALKQGAVDRRAVPDDETCAAAEHYSGPLDPRFAITGSAFLYNAGRDGTLTQRHLDLIKQQLAAGHPVPIAMRLYLAPASEPGRPITSLSLLQSDEVYAGSLAPHGERMENHAMVAVGYDERRRAFLVQNSWGPGWADGGFGWIGYDAMQADLTDASVMRVAFEPPRPTPGLAQRAPGEIAASANSELSACSAVVPRGKTPDGKTRLTGFVENYDDLDLLDARGSYDTDDVAVRPYPVCEAMKTLQGPLESPLAPQLFMLDGYTDLAFGDSLAFEVITPSVPSFLYLVYLDANGQAVNLAPRIGPLRTQHAPFTRLVFGDGGPGRQTFVASEPAGNEAIIAIAARSPMSELEALETGQMLFRMPALAAEVDSDESVDVATRQLFLTGVAPPTRPADDRYYLSAVKRALSDRPDLDALPREVGAAILHLRVGGEQ